MIELMIDAVQRWQGQLLERGVTVAISPPLPGDTDERRAIRVDADSERALAQMILWNTGELDLIIGDASGSVLVDEHREVSSSIGVDDAFASIADHLGTSGA